MSLTGFFVDTTPVKEDTDDKTEVASPTSAEEKPDSLGLSGIETRVKAACACVGADFSMTVDQVLAYIPASTVYAYAHKEGQDLTSVVKEVLQRTMAVEDGLDQVVIDTNVDREALYGLLNWFDVFDYAVQNRESLVEVMKYVLKTHGAHLLQGGDNDESEAGSKSKATNKQSSYKGPEEKKFDLELQRLRKARGIPDGKSTRFGQRSE